MLLPTGFYPIREQLSAILPHLRQAQYQGLTYWVLGTLLAGRATLNAVLTALQGTAPLNTLRQRLRETLCDGKDRACPGKQQLETELCFAHLVTWVIAHSTAPKLALACDTTSF